RELIKYLESDTAKNDVGELLSRRIEIKADIDMDKKEERVLINSDQFAGLSLLGVMEQYLREENDLILEVKKAGEDIRKRKVNQTVLIDEITQKTASINSPVKYEEVFCLLLLNSLIDSKYAEKNLNNVKGIADILGKMLYQDQKRMMDSSRNRIGNKHTIKAAYKNEKGKTAVKSVGFADFVRYSIEGVNKVTGFKAIEQILK
ncbi:MAG: hypothetical protein AABZ57_01765, partial [Candidatus Margulisiibacteriota bacterium]